MDQINGGGCGSRWIRSDTTSSGAEVKRKRDQLQPTPDHIPGLYKEVQTMAYVKHGTGPNDYKKGNRTKGENRRGNRSGRPGTPPEDQRGLRASEAAKAEMKEHYKQIAEQQANVIKYGQPYAATLHDNLCAYIIDRQNKHKPLTIAGLILASGMSADTYKRYRDGDADHMLYEYMDLHDIPFTEEGNIFESEDGAKVLLLRLSTIIKTAELAVQEQLEENCYTNRGNPAGSIFGLKARYEWRDDPDKVQQTNTLNIQVASLDEAKQALKRLSE